LSFDSFQELVQAFVLRIVFVVADVVVVVAVVKEITEKVVFASQRRRHIYQKAADVLNCLIS